MRRRVALKVIKLGMDSKQVVARFEAERQALPMMDHPNIAKVLDAGATGEGEAGNADFPVGLPTPADPCRSSAHKLEPPPRSAGAHVGLSSGSRTY